MAGWTDGARGLAQSDTYHVARLFVIKHLNGFRVTYLFAFITANTGLRVEHEHGVTFALADSQRVDGTDLHTKSAQGAVFSAGDGGK